MRKLFVVSAFALATLTSGAMATEPLTVAQLDQVTAAGFQQNNNYTRQIAVAISVAKAGCVVAICKNSGNAASLASASNSNVTGQANVD
jgi:3D (Asp-Asp-Asp) domain-containing protein